MEKKILIIDDTEESISLLLKTLVQSGYAVLIAKNGKQGLSIALRAQPDLILLDAVMPQMNGFTVCEKLKKNPK